MDAYTDPAVETVVVMCSAQIGKTAIMLNVIGYFTHKDPSPILVVLPNIEVAKDFSTTRLSPMIRDSPVLKKIFGKKTSRSTSNTILAKEFPGGRIAIVGANAPSGLSSKPIRIVLMDEVRLFKPNIDGNPIKQSTKRTTAFFNRKIGMFSTPGIQGECKITEWYEKSDMRKHYVPCPHCGHFQVMKFGNLKWKKDKDKKAIESSIRYECENQKCRKKISFKEKAKMILDGEWRAEKPLDKIAGFWINELSSPFRTWLEMIRDFEETKENREILRDFVNLSLGETWVEEGIEIGYDTLYDWREDYGKGVDIPEGGLILTGSCDVQKSYIQGEIVAWGVGQESWGVEEFYIQGDPTLQQTWDDLELKLKTVYKHKNGTLMQASCVTIDTGYLTSEVYAFTKKFEIMRWFSTKGRSTTGSPIVPAKPSVVGRLKNKLFMIGTDTAKQLIYNRLLMKRKDGYGKMHFPMKYTEEYFKQLTAEKSVSKKDAYGYVKRVWKKLRPRNEVLDIRVGSLAAITILNPNFKELAKRGPMLASSLRPKKKRRQRSSGVKL
jgi:phage terminase large subunit GpA-like protein